MRRNRTNRTIGAWAAGFLLASVIGAPASAQDDAPPSPRPSAQAYERLDDIDERVAAYVEKWRRQQEEEAEKARGEAAKSGGAMPAMSMHPDLSPFLEKLVDWADAAEGEDRALYLAHVIEIDGDLSKGMIARKALDRLCDDHPTSYVWSRLGRDLPHWAYWLGEKRHKELLAMLANSPHPDVRGWVVLAEVSDRIEDAELDSEAYREAKAKLLAAAEEASDPDLIDELKAPIDLRETYGLGVKAPDIVGVDLDGTPFQLSDYRGKIIMLDFWGDW